MAPNGPVRHGLADRAGCDPFVVAIVPLDDVLADLHLMAKASQLAGSSGPLKGGAEHRCELLLLQDWLQGFGFGLTIREKRKVCAAGVPAVPCPLSCSMAQQPELARHAFSAGDLLRMDSVG